MLSALTLNDQLALALGVLGLLFLLINLLLLKNKQPKHIPEPAKEAVESLLHISSEQGRRLVVGLGHALTNTSFDLAGASGLSLQRALLKRSLFNDHPLQSFSGDGTLACLSRMVVHGAYRNALASELFQGSLSQLSGTSPLAYTASLVNYIPESSNAGLLLAGRMSPAMLLVLDQADRQLLPAVSALSSISGQAASFFGNSLNLMGEDIFNAAGKLDQRKSALASLSAQDWLRIAISLGLLLGAILKMGGMLP
jgi:hypothetical protein